MRLTILIALLVLASCREKADHVRCPAIPDNKQQATSTNDRARRAQYPSLSDAQYDSLAKANCYTVPK